MSKDAIDALEHGPYDLLLTDIVMPGADGIEVVQGAKGVHGGAVQVVGEHA